MEVCSMKLVFLNCLEWNNSATSHPVPNRVLMMKILHLLSAVCRGAFLLNHNYTLKINITGLNHRTIFYNVKKGSFYAFQKRILRRAEKEYVYIINEHMQA